MNKLDKATLDQMSALLSVGVSDQVLPGSTSSAPSIGFGNSLVHEFSTNSTGGQASVTASQGPDASSLGAFPSVAALAMDNAPAPGTPAAEFKANVQLALNQHLPQLAALAQSVLDGFENAYNPEVNPNKTADDYITLINMVSQFYEFLRESGVGALPLLDVPSGQTAQNPSDIDAMALDIIPSPTKDSNTNMSEDELRVSLNTTVNAQYSREHRVQNNAGVVLSRLLSKVSPGGF